ncbi:MAG: hypothetical protein ACI4UO_05550, partial [Paludibacteraceae bacterium]
MVSKALHRHLGGTYLTQPHTMPPSMPTENIKTLRRKTIFGCLMVLLSDLFHIKPRTIQAGAREHLPYF